MLIEHLLRARHCSSSENTGTHKIDKYFCLHGIYVSLGREKALVNNRYNKVHICQMVVSPMETNKGRAGVVEWNRNWVIRERIL